MKVKALDLGISTRQMKSLENFAIDKGYKSLPDYLLSLHKNNLQNEHPKTYEIPTKRGKLNPVYKTRRGQIIHGNSLDWLHNSRYTKSVDLIMTSPPFGLIKKKAYGNEAAHAYVSWFRQFAEGFSNVLKDDGSLVIDISGAWEKGYPVRSLYHFDVLTMLCREYGFNLCQEHYWWNPSKLPSPAQWVNVYRSRVKDSVNCIWWLSKSKHPKADNTKVLAPYSTRMEEVLKAGIKSNTRRPSGHSITSKFNKNNGGSIPPNLIAIANSESNGAYFQYCKDYGFDIHPARFPQALPEYFIKFLTEPGDFVLDPFGGSSMTGYVAEKLGRKWRSIELDELYALSGTGRFLDRGPFKTASSKYEIFSPCYGHKMTSRDNNS
jgi:DNA modification methylase